MGTVGQSTSIFGIRMALVLLWTQSQVVPFSRKRVSYHPGAHGDPWLLEHREAGGAFSILGHPQAGTSWPERLRVQVSLDFEKLCQGCPCSAEFLETERGKE